MLHSASGDGGKFTLCVEIHPGYVWIGVEDAGGPWNRARHGDGRPHGLDVVEAITGPGNWGVDGDTAGRIAWARIVTLSLTTTDLLKQTFKLTTTRGGEDLMPVPGDENQAGVRDEDTVSASADVTVLEHSIEYNPGMQLRYNYRLDPQPRHRIAFGKAFGCARVVFNDGLRARQEAHQAGLPYITDAELSARLTAAKAAPERAWLGEVSAVVLQQALADLNAAYRNFFASLKGERKGPKTGPPRFRSRKDTRQAIRFTANARFKVLPNGKLRLPKIGDVPVRWSRPLPSEPSSVTVIRDSAGRYFASFVVQAGPGTLPEAEPVIGIDLGLKHFAVCRTAGRSPPRGSCAGRRRNSGGRSVRCPASRREAGTGTRPGSRSPGRMPGWPTRGGTFTTSCPRR